MVQVLASTLLWRNILAQPNASVAYSPDVTLDAGPSERGIVNVILSKDYTLSKLTQQINHSNV